MPEFASSPSSETLTPQQELALLLAMRNYLIGDEQSDSPKLPWIENVDSDSAEEIASYLKDIRDNPVASAVLLGHPHLPFEPGLAMHEKLTQIKQLIYAAIRVRALNSQLVKPISAILESLKQHATCLLTEAHASTSQQVSTSHNVNSATHLAHLRKGHIRRTTLKPSNRQTKSLPASTVMAPMSITISVPPAPVCAADMITHHHRLELSPEAATSTPPASPMIITPPSSPMRPLCRHKTWSHGLADAEAEMVQPTVSEPQQPLLLRANGFFVPTPRNGMAQAIPSISASLTISSFKGLSLSSLS